MTRDWTEEEIAAWVDGALESPEDAGRIARAIEGDAEAARLAGRIAASNRLLREAFDAPMRESVPPKIAAALAARPGRVAVLRDRAAPVVRRAAALAVAASLVFAVGFGTGLLTGGDDAPGPVAGIGAHDPSDPLAEALERLPSGDVSPAGLRPMLTFRDAEGRPCREFETTRAAAGAVGIACRAGGGGWTVQVMVAAADAGDAGGGYAPASGPAGDALDAALDALGAGPALTPQAEAALIAEGWRSAAD